MCNEPFFLSWYHMEDVYKTLEKPAGGMFRDRNSKFLAFGFAVSDTRQVDEILTGIRKKYHDARHHCFAYRIGNHGENSRMNDDGEPSGTAGKPILNQIISHDLTNVLVVVVRYFGGTLLGTGGLIHAYRSATADMLEKALIAEKFVTEKYELNFPYEKLSAIMKIIKDENIQPHNPVYDVQCVMQVEVRKSLSQRFLSKLLLVAGVKTQLMESGD